MTDKDAEELAALRRDLEDNPFNFVKINGVSRSLLSDLLARLDRFDRLTTERSGEIQMTDADELAALRTLRLRLHEQLGEAVHAGFRKGADGAASKVVWRAIADCPQQQFSDAINFTLYGLELGLELPPLRPIKWAAP